MRLDEQTRGDFPILSRIINGHPLVYLDSAASSQKPRSVVEAMTRYYETSHANVHRSIHTLGEEATELYELARDRVQRFIGAARREAPVMAAATTRCASFKEPFDESKPRTPRVTISGGEISSPVSASIVTTSVTMPS